MLVVGVARKKQVVTDGDVLLPAGATVFSIALDMNGSPATGVIFSGSNLETRFRAALPQQGRRRGRFEAGLRDR